MLSHSYTLHCITHRSLLFSFYQSFFFRSQSFFRFLICFAYVFFLVTTTTTTVWYAAVSFMINYIHSYDLAICCNCILFTFFLFGLTRLFFCVHIGCDLIFFCFWLQVIKSASAIIHPVPPPLTVLTNTIGGFAQRDQLVSKTRDEGNTIRCYFISILDAIVWTSVCVCMWLYAWF